MKIDSEEKRFFVSIFIFTFDFNKFTTNKPDGLWVRCPTAAAQALHSPRPLRVALSARREQGAPVHDAATGGAAYVSAGRGAGMEHGGAQ